MRISPKAVCALASAVAAGSFTEAFSISKRAAAHNSQSLSPQQRPFTTPTFCSTAAPTETLTPNNNPLTEYKTLPKFTKIEPNQFTPAVSSILSDISEKFKTFESTVDTKSPSYDEVLPEIERMQAPLEFSWGIAGHLNGVKNSPELREEYEKNQPEVVKSMMQFSQSKVLYDALQSLHQQLERGDLPAETEFLLQQKKRAIENSLRSMTLGGVGLEGEEKVRFNEIRTRMAELSTKFSNNILDATKAFELIVDDPNTVGDVPDSAKAMWFGSYANKMKEDGKEVPEGASPETGPWRITLDMPSYIAAMQHLKDRSVREEIYRASITRASEFKEEQNNIPHIMEILKLRKEACKLLGFENFAEQSLASKMAPSVESIKELSDLIKEKALPAAIKEMEEITAYARKNGGDEYAEEKVEKLMPWDITYWSERLKETKYELKEEELRPYFALPNVLDGMFGLVNRIFGINIKEAEEGEVEVWHPDVQFFKVYDDESGEHIASFFLDPYSRPENKRGGAWMDVCLGKTNAVEGREIPVAYLTCNGSPPTEGKPSLMTFREVETLFHEFGHGLQHMLTRAEIGDVAGINGVEWDAVELPSQFMENWCYDKPTIYGFAKHYSTGEPLPEEYFEKLKAQKTYNAGMMAMRQVYFGMMDIELHTNFDPEGDESIFDVQRRMAEIYSPYNMPIPEDRFLCTFGHIFAGGYAAGYYSYKWAEVMSADAFGAFEDVGLDNEEEVKKVGKKFRDTVLSLGGGVPPMEVFKEFRGREPSPEALLRHSGLA